MTDSASDLPDFNQLWDYNDPAATEAKFRELLASTAAAGNEDYRLQLLTQIARAQGLQRNFDEAHQTLNEVEQQLHLASQHPQVEVRYLLERGRVYNSSQHSEQAKPLFETAWEKARAAGAEGYAVDAAHMMGIVERGEASLVWNERAMAYAESARDPQARRWLGSLYNNIGWTYHDQGDYHKALVLFEKAQAWFQQHGNSQTQRIARWTIARVFRSLGRIDAALAVQQELLKALEATGESDGFVMEELAECHYALGRKAEAKEYFAKAHAALSQDPWLMESEPQRIQRLHDLANEEIHAG